ncbi:MAG: hypothetical protein M1820_009428 [Bogoriella megaspora]|nr:MAG: hypothetical protein M1820_009428 [Bogoriella megaspora]
MEHPRSPRRRKDITAYGVSPNRTEAADKAWSRVRSSSYQNREASIRPVTPESIPEDRVANPSSLEETLIGTPPGISPANSAHASPRILPRNPLQRIDPSDAAQTTSFGGVSRDRPTRQRTRTIDAARPREVSPSSLLLNYRNRIGSVHAVENGKITTVGPNGDAISSIGHISTIPGPSDSSSPNSVASLSRLPSRNINSPPPDTDIQPDTLLAPVITGNAKKVLGLMKSTCGKMQGILAFRRGDGMVWELSYCAIDEESGSLHYEPKDHESFHKTLVPDLRGCQVKKSYDHESQMPYIDVQAPHSNLQVHLRPHTRGEFDSWFAALLCWQPMQPKGIQNKMAKAQPPVQPEGTTSGNRRHSEVTPPKEAPIIKVGKMIFWDTNISYSNAGTPKSPRPAAYRMQSLGSRRWRRVSCTLRENGELRLFSETDIMLVSVVQLSQLSRCAIQRLHPSVLDNEFCIAIYPQYTSTSTSLSLLRPIFLSLESRILYEVWVVLLRAFTIPQLYGPKQLPNGQNASNALEMQKIMNTPTRDMFRMERSLTLKVIEAKLTLPSEPQPKKNPIGRDRRGTDPTDISQGYYMEVLLDGEVRAKTMAKYEGNLPFWREEFDFLDLPAVLSSAALLLKRRGPELGANDRERADSHRLVQQAYGFSENSSEGYSGISFDQAIGNVDIYLEELDSRKEIERWWPITDPNGQQIGEVLVKARAEESVILMSRDYQQLSELLHRFANGLTLQICDRMSGELARLSEYLLNIFQVSGQAGEWFMSLVEEEIDSIHRESPSMTRRGRAHRVNSNESADSSGGISCADREVLVRDFGSKATQEANLLFRANTLLTKALEIHMRRVGKEYLEETLTEKIKEINDQDVDCEVDPNRIQNPQDLDRNWRKLISLTKGIWSSIFASSARCPDELKIVFRHIRACAEDQYGDFLRTVRFSSVSGFVFLRFFCPAVLNPKLFGLLKDHARPRARRTLTLIAKALQGLANMTTFGSKETWMEPMNQFLSGHREEFKSFIDQVCTLSNMAGRSSSTAGLPPPPPAYSTPLAILNRLPPTSREGFPSLPYLVDHARNYAALIQLWLSSQSKNRNGITAEDGDLLTFHGMCVELNGRTQQCLERAERAERPTSGSSLKWEELVESLETVQLGSSTLAERRKSSVATAIQEEGTPRVRSFAGKPGAAPLAIRGSASVSSASLADSEALSSTAVEHSLSNSQAPSMPGTDSNISSPITPYSAGGRRAGTFFPPAAISTSTSASASVTTSARPSPTSYLDSQDSSDGAQNNPPPVANTRHRARSSTPVFSPTSSQLLTDARSPTQAPIPERNMSKHGPFARSPYTHTNVNLSATFSDDDATTALPEYTPERADREKGWDRQRVSGRHKIKKHEPKSEAAGAEIEKEREKAKSRGGGFLPGWKKKKEKGEGF